MKLHSFLPALVAASLFAPACDVTDLMPATAADGGKPSARVTVSLGVAGLSDLPDAVTDMDVEVVDVLLHRAEDDVWLLVSNEPASLALADSMGDVRLTGIPVGTGAYDRVLVALGDVTVADATGWSPVHLPQAEIEVELDANLLVDSELAIQLEVNNALHGNNGHWTLTPKFAIWFQIGG